jgi:hypothetical protein
VEIAGSGLYLYPLNNKMPLFGLNGTRMRFSPWLSSGAKPNEKRSRNPLDNPSVSLSISGGEWLSGVVATLLAVDFTTADFFAFLAFAQGAFAAAATSNGHGEIQGSFTAFRRTTSKTGLAASKSGVQDDDIKGSGSGIESRVSSSFWSRRRLFGLPPIRVW